MKFDFAKIAQICAARSQFGTACKGCPANMKPERKSDSCCMLDVPRAWDISAMEQAIHEMTALYEEGIPKPACYKCTHGSVDNGVLKCFIAYPNTIAVIDDYCCEDFEPSNEWADEFNDGQET